MRAGDLDRSIDIQASTAVQNTVGEPILTWSNVAASVPARVMPTRGGERFTAQQVVGDAVVTFRIRYRTGLTVRNRLVYNGKNWDIRDIREIGRREGLEIDATARSDG